MAKRLKTKRHTVGFVALGCPKNIVDSEKMLAHIAQAGFLIVAEPNEADVIIVNTCGFIAPAAEEALSAIRKALASKKRGKARKVIVTGCLPQRMGEKLFEQAPGIDAIVGLGQRDNIADIIKRTLGSEETGEYLAHSCHPIDDDRQRLLITPPHRAYLRISEGCSHRCSFCTIPSIRGALRSKPIELVLEEAGELGQSGVVEVSVIGQDTTAYGRDLGMKDGLSKLLKKIEKDVPAIKWLRLMYTYPTEISERLIETVAASEKIVHYFDIPLQHISDKILRLMRRPDTHKSICRLLERLRGRMPDVALRTTLIIGFPGETEEQFEELLEFVRWAQFDALGCFKFYPEPGTDAFSMPGQVSEKVKERRVRELMLEQQKIAFAKNRKRVGSQLLCVVDSARTMRAATGRFYGQAPEIDSHCIIRRCSLGPGEF